MSPSITLRLDANEGVGQTDAVLEALRSVTAEDLRRYPDATALERRIADEHDVDASQIVLTNGGDDAIDRICRAVLQPGRTMLTHEPGFVMITRGARLAGATVETIEWVGGTFPDQRFLDSLDSSVALVALVSPNNPTGGLIPVDAMISIARAAAANKTLVMVDLAYIEFAASDPTSRLLDEPNVVVVRTMSKAFGLAGVRVGYAIAPNVVADWLRTVGGPYPVSSLSVAVALRALEHAAERDSFITEVGRERDELCSLLRDVGGNPVESQANFVLARFADADRVHAHLVEHGILVRSFRNSPMLADALRITLPGLRTEFHRLQDALRSFAATDTVDHSPTPVTETRP
ncbi:MAG: histidinol-phosphate transaminase [Planctomycetota bacterium]